MAPLSEPSPTIWTPSFLSRVPGLGLTCRRRGERELARRAFLKFDLAATTRALRANPAQIVRSSSNWRSRPAGGQLFRVSRLHFWTRRGVNSLTPMEELSARRLHSLRA